MTSRDTSSTGMAGEAYLRTPLPLTWPIAVLASVASAAGLLVNDLYRDPPGIRPAMRGQDAVTLVMAPLLIVLALATRQGSTRAAIAWVGLLGYLFYTYTGAAFGYHFNELLLVDVLLASMTGVALAVTLRECSTSDLARRFDGREPRLAVAGFLVAVAVLLAAIEIGENVRYLATGIVPPAVANAGGTTFFPYVLDLGLIVPLSIVAAVWLLGRRPMGYLLAGALLIKASSMGFALLAMNGFSQQAGVPADGLSPFYGLLALGGLGLSIVFLRHCRSDDDPAQATCRRHVEGTS